MSAQSCAWSRPALAPGAHSIASACNPCIAAQVLSPITATRSSSTTTCRTPGTASAFDWSTEPTLPPITGEAISVANFIPGRITSMP